MKGINKSILNGLSGIILRDITVEKDIINMANMINLNGKLLL
jgi:hypothetical protein